MSLERRDMLALGIGAGLLSLSRQASGKPSISTRIPLWPAGPPEAIPADLRLQSIERSTIPNRHNRAISGVASPWIEMFRPSCPNGAAIISMPGGGYRYMAYDKEGVDLGRWFAARGVTAFALGYRLPYDGWASGVNAPLADAQRALRLIRANADQWGIDPRRIAVMGFSAGGHLCANVAAHYDRGVYASRDAIDEFPIRPDLAAPIYPGVMVDEIAPSDGTVSLFGKSASAATIAFHSPHRNVRDDAPPHFLLHAEDDDVISPAHSLALRAALRAKNIVVETHLYSKGGHGFGLRETTGLPLADWPERLMSFGRFTGWLPA